MPRTQLGSVTLDGDGISVGAPTSNLSSPPERGWPNRRGSLGAVMGRRLDEGERVPTGFDIRSPAILVETLRHVEKAAKASVREG